MNEVGNSGPDDEFACSQPRMYKTGKGVSVAYPDDSTE